MDIMETGCEEVNCIDMCLSFIQLWASVLAVLNVALQLQGNCWYTPKFLGLRGDVHMMMF
jgi:hypothetical protein